MKHDEAKQVSELVDGMSKRTATLISERDDLLAALKLAEDFLQPSLEAQLFVKTGKKVTRGDAERLIRAAIQRAEDKGEPK